MKDKDYESIWVETYDLVMRDVDKGDVDYESLMELFYGQEVSEYLYGTLVDDGLDIKDSFYKNVNNICLQLHREGWFQAKGDIVEIFSIGTLFRKLGYEVDNLQEEFFYQFGEHLLKVNERKTKSCDIYIRDAKNNTSVRFSIDINGTWELLNNHSPLAIGSLKRYSDFENLLNQISIYFNLLMSTEYDLLSEYTTIDREEGIYEGEKEKENLHTIYLDEQDRIERQHQHMRALARAQAYMTGQPDPYPEGE